MRYDSVGLFWQELDYKTETKEALLKEEGWSLVFLGFWAEQYKLDNGVDPRTICMGLDAAYSEAKVNKTGEKRSPPEPVWLAPDYLPGLEEARKFPVQLFTDDELINLSLEQYSTGKKHKLIFDVECYGNYFLVAFVSIELGKVAFLELSDEQGLQSDKLKWLFHNFCMVGFNSKSYDIWIISMAIGGCSTAQMKSCTTAIIEYGEKGWVLIRRYKIKKVKCDHIDLIEVAPLSASLKIYGGRMHSRKLQDLPFPPDSVLSEPQRTVLRWYCINDLLVTLDLYKVVLKEITLRETMGLQYGVELRSKSDAQIAEVVIGAELEKLNGCRAHKPHIEAGTCYKYNPPKFICFTSPLLRNAYQVVLDASFEVSEFGNIGLPEQVSALELMINQTRYKMGIGGLHSTEKTAAHFATQDIILKDVDVTSYYPFIILNSELYPKHLGANFLIVYRDLVERRVRAKKAGDKVVADTIKIVVNGSFGKLGSVYSILYAPDLLIQVTLTGQLSLLMLIERLELAGVPIVSANTDGIVIKCPKPLEAVMDSVIAQWEQDTQFNTEESLYAALYSRDVNNYMAIKSPCTWENGATTKDKIKTKGVFATPGLSKNPQNEICILAIKELLLNRTPLEATIRNCKNIRKFINVRTVKGGAVKLQGDPTLPGLYLGKAIRWYYAKDTPGDIVYAKTGNKVPRSNGAQPLMELPDIFPENVDYDWYITEASKILKQMGHS